MVFRPPQYPKLEGYTWVKSFMVSWHAYVTLALNQVIGSFVNEFL